MSNQIVETVVEIVRDSDMVLRSTELSAEGKRRGVEYFTLYSDTPGRIEIHHIVCKGVQK